MSKNVTQAFNTQDSQDCRFICDGVGCRDCQDCNETGFCELSYEVIEIFPKGYNDLFCVFGAETTSLIYCDHCYNSRHLFGCVGLRRNEFCILNRQYTEAEYERLIPQIIQRMRSDGEWGEFFPAALSRFAYNETVAQEYFPLKKEEVMKRGWKWREGSDELPNVQKVIEAKQLPDSIDAIPDDILQWAIRCEVTDRPFKIIKQELDFYRDIKLPVPHLHPDERHKQRMALRNPRKLWDRMCSKCKAKMKSSYTPECSEIVYCESCYLREVY